MYNVKALGTATYPKRKGENPTHNNWVAGMVDSVDDELIQYYNDHTDVFTVLTQSGASPTGLAVVSGLTAVDNTRDGVIHQTVFTLVNVAQAVVNATEYQSTLLYTFPAGRIHVLGVTGSLAEKTTSVILDTLNGGKTGALGLGTAAASATTLATTMVDLAPSTSFLTSTVINVSAAAVGFALAANAQFDGTGTAIPMYLNSAFATTGDVDANATIAWNGTITVTWCYLGDY